MFLVNNPNRFVTNPSRAIDLKVAKNRYGDKIDIPLIFKPDIGVFCEAADGFH